MLHINLKPRSVFPKYIAGQIGLVVKENEYKIDENLYLYVIKQQNFFDKVIQFFCSVNKVVLPCVVCPYNEWSI